MSRVTMTGCKENKPVIAICPWSGPSPCRRSNGGGWRDGKGVEAAMNASAHSLLSELPDIPFQASRSGKGREPEQRNILWGTALLHQTLSIVRFYGTFSHLRRLWLCQPFRVFVVGGGGWLVVSWPDLLQRPCTSVMLPFILFLLPFSLDK